MWRIAGSGRLAALGAAVALGTLAPRARAQVPEDTEPGGPAASDEELVPPPPPPEDTGASFEVGLRSGYAVPLGKVADDAAEDIDSVLAAQVPIWVDLGARFSRRLFFGIQASYGVGILSSDMVTACDSAAAAGVDLKIDCRGSDVRGGFELLYHSRLKPHVDPWFGGGMGWEWLSVDIAASAPGQSASLAFSANGLELFTPVDLRRRSSCLQSLALTPAVPSPARFASSIVQPPKTVPNMVRDSPTQRPRPVPSRCAESNRSSPTIRLFSRSAIRRRQHGAALGVPAGPCEPNSGQTAEALANAQAAIALTVEDLRARGELVPEA